MAVYTEVHDDDLTQFLERYDLGELLSYKGIAEGVENTNYLLRTEKGPFILTLYEKRVNQEELPFFLELMEHFARKGIPCPTPLHDRTGAVLQELAGRPAVIVSFLEGFSVYRIAVDHCAQLGGALADLHAAGADFPMHRENALSLSGWRQLVAETVERADEVLKGFSDEILSEIKYLEENWPKNLPSGIIHADLFPDNVFFLSNKISGLIDFRVSKSMPSFL